MIVNKKYVLRQFRDMWGSIPYIAMADKSYWLPKKSDVRGLIFDTYFEKYNWTKEVFDCDDFALILNAYVKQEMYKTKEYLPWAFGEAWGTCFDGIKQDHAVNIVLTRSGIHLIDPIKDKIWKGYKKYDQVYFIRM